MPEGGFAAALEAIAPEGEAPEDAPAPPDDAEAMAQSAAVRKFGAALGIDPEKIDVERLSDALRTLRKLDM